MDNEQLLASSDSMQGVQGTVDVMSRSRSLGLTQSNSTFEMRAGMWAPPSCSIRTRRRTAFSRTLWNMLGRAVRHLSA